MKHIFALLAMFIALPLFAQQVDLVQLDTYFEKTVQDWGIPGMSVGIVKDGEIIFSKGYGVLEVGKTRKPDGNTLYAIASNTKAFTSTLIAMLVQEGKLDWDDQVQKYIPYFQLYDRYVSTESTIRDLLCHRVGLGTFSGDVIWYKSGFTAEEIIKRMKFLELKFSFRDGYGYSNLMYITAGAVIEQVTGKSWGENIQERILDPLKMDRTIYSLKKLDEKKNYATPHAIEEEKNIPITWEDWEKVAALGGLISSVNDISRWMIFNMNHGIIKEDTLLSANSINTLWKMHNPYTVNRIESNDFNTNFRGYGLGWGLSDFYGNLRLSHGGGYDGMISAVNMIPDKKLGVVVLTNGMKAPTMAVTYYALDAFLGRAEKDWSTELLQKRNDRNKEDNRITERKAQRVTGTNPSLPVNDYSGTYFSDIYGNIMVKLENNGLRLFFEHTPDLSATLEHWHYDVWKINWDKTHAWFNFGTLKFNLNNNLEITGMNFDVPNNDIFFDELKPQKVK